MLGWLCSALWLNLARVMSALLDTPERLLSTARIGIADVADGQLMCRLRALVYALNSDAVLLAMGLSLEPELSAGELVRLSARASSDGLARVGVVENSGRSRSPAAERIIMGFAKVLGSTTTLSGAAHER